MTIELCVYDRDGTRTETTVDVMPTRELTDGDRAVLRDAAVRYDPFWGPFSPADRARRLANTVYDWLRRDDRGWSPAATAEAIRIVQAAAPR